MAAGELPTFLSKRPKEPLNDRCDRFASQQTSSHASIRDMRRSLLNTACERRKQKGHLTRRVMARIFNCEDPEYMGSETRQKEMSESMSAEDLSTGDEDHEKEQCNVSWTPQSPIQGV